MSDTLLTIGMACHTDFNGVYMTVNNIRLNHNVTNCEIVVIDNNPNSEEGENTKKFLENVRELPCRYIPYTTVGGTAQPRNEIFRQAQGDFVLVLDSHVFVFPKSIEQLKQYFLRNPQTNDLYAGSLYMDNYQRVATHMLPFWRGEMWGIWASAWITPEGETVQTFDNNGKLMLLNMNAPFERPTPEMEWSGHEEKLVSMGYIPRGFPGDEPFEIPAHGLGLFACRKEAWLGFNEHFREFGGEECYIHEKYRQAGHTTYLLPFMGWQHRWYKPGGNKYSLSTINKFRNYVLGCIELGLATDDAYRHFLEVGVPKEQLDKVIKDPIRYTPSQPFPREVTPYSSRIDIYQHYKGIERDLNRHADYLRNLASKCRVVVELTKRRESTIFLLAGNPEHLHSYHEELDPAIELLKTALSKEVHSNKKISLSITPYNHDSGIPDFPPCDLLFLDTRHTYARLSVELETVKSKVGRFIVIHDTKLYGKKGEDNKEGLGKAIKDFLKNNPAWFIHSHTDNQFGLTVLGIQDQDKPQHTLTPFSVDCGAGYELKKLLKMIGITATENCSCNARALEMDQKGIEWCKANVEKIVGWLKEEYDKRQMKLPFSFLFATLLVRRAIRNASRRKCE